MLTLAQAKAHLKLDPTATDEDEEVGRFLAAALGIFRVQSKRRWPQVGEPVLAKASDLTTNPPTLEFTSYIDPAVLSPDEQAIADQFILLTIGHFYENRQTVAVGLNVTEVPQGASALMRILREPTL